MVSFKHQLMPAQRRLELARNSNAEIELFHWRGELVVQEIRHWPALADMRRKYLHDLIKQVRHIGKV